MLVSSRDNEGERLVGLYRRILEMRYKLDKERKRSLDGLECYDVARGANNGRILHKRLGVKQAFIDVLHPFGSFGRVSEIFQTYDSDRLETHFQMDILDRKLLVKVKLVNSGLVNMGKPEDYIKVKGYNMSICDNVLDQNWKFGVNELSKLSRSGSDYSDQRYLIGMSPNLSFVKYYPSSKLFSQTSLKQIVKWQKPAQFIDFEILQNGSLIILTQIGTLVIITQDGYVSPLDLSIKYTPNNQEGLRFGVRPRFIYEYNLLKFISADNFYIELDPVSSKTINRLEVDSNTRMFDVYNKRLVFMSEEGSFSEANRKRTRLHRYEQPVKEEKVEWNLFKVFEGVVLQGGFHLQEAGFYGARNVVRTMVVFNKRKYEYHQVYVYGMIMLSRSVSR